METVDRLLEKSVSYYRNLLDKTKEIGPLLDEVDPEELTRLAESIQAMQQDVRRVDQELMGHLQKEKDDIRNNPLFHERIRLMEEIVQHNNFISPIIYDKMSVSQAELKAIRHGRRSLSGYQLHNGKNGGTGTLNRIQ